MGFNGAVFDAAATAGSNCICLRGQDPAGLEYLGHTDETCVLPDEADPCASVDCGSYKTCNRGACMCTNGYTGPTCNWPPKLCENISECRAFSNLAFCHADGYCSCMFMTLAKDTEDGAWTCE